MLDWKQKADAMRTEIKELRTSFARMAAMAESLDEKLKKQNEASMKVSAQEINRITRDMEGELTRLLQSSLLIRSCDDNRDANVLGIDDEKLTDFSEHDPGSTEWN